VQRFVGADVSVCPLSLPQAPLTAARANVPIALESAFKLNVQSPVPEQADAEPLPTLQPSHVEPPFAVPEIVIDKFAAALHSPVLPFQDNVQPLAVIVPLPVPAFEMIKL
jgi:hypothetical protein